MALTRQTFSFIYYKYVQRTQEPNKILEFKSIISKMKTLLKLEI